MVIGAVDVFAACTASGTASGGPGPAADGDQLHPRSQPRLPGRRADDDVVDRAVVLSQTPREKLSSIRFELLARSFWYSFGWSV